MTSLHYRSLHHSLQSRLFGGKAYGLSWLVRNGFPVPAGTALAALSAGEWADVSLETLRAVLAKAVETLQEIPAGGFIVRSSATDEDTVEASSAGRYLSVRTEADLDSLTMNCYEVVMGSLKRLPSGERLGIVIQHWVEAAVGGVAASTDPIEFTRGTCVVEESTGSAAEVAQRGRISNRTTLSLPEHPNASTMERPWRLAKWLSEIELLWRSPIEVEWVAQLDGSILLLQCRSISVPVDSRDVTVVDLADPDAISKVPALLKANPKILLRTQLRSMNIAVGSAMLYMVAGIKISERRVRPRVKVPQSDTVAGVSAVLLYPRTVEGRVQRKFLSYHQDNVEFFTAECQRYAIRRYPSKSSLDESVVDLLEEGLNHNWFAGVITQNIIDGAVTGLLSAPPSGEVLVEFASGHFIPKGVVDTRQYLVSRDLEVTEISSPEQMDAYWLMDGYVVHEQPLDPGHIDMPSEEAIAGFASWIRPVSDQYPERVWEFGAQIDRSSGEWRPYVIDYIESKASSLPPPDQLHVGVISPGRISGIVKHVMNEQSSGFLDVHHGDDFRTSVEGNALVFVAERPDISLLDLVYSAAKSGSSFLFRSGTLLSHTAIVMRELGVGGLIIGDQVDALRDGQWVDADLRVGRIAVKAE